MIQQIACSTLYREEGSRLRRDTAGPGDLGLPALDLNPFRQHPVDGAAVADLLDAGALLVIEVADDLGPNPTRTLEGALAACAVMTMRMYAARKKWPLTSVAVTVMRAPGEDGHVVKNLIKEIEIVGDLDDEQRARIKEIGDRCPVHRMLTEGVQIESRQA